MFILFSVVFTGLAMFLGVDGQLVIYRSSEGLSSSCPLTVISPTPQVNLRALYCDVLFL